MIKIVKYIVIVVLGMVLFMGCGSDGEDRAKIAMDKIIYFAENDEPIPTVEDYELAGVIGVTDVVLLEINEVISNLSKEEVDTKEEIQALINALGVEVVMPTASPTPKATPRPTPAPTPVSSRYDFTYYYFTWFCHGDYSQRNELHRCRSNSQR